MTTNDLLQLALYLAVLLALVKPLGAWMTLAFAEQPNALTRAGAPVERAIYRTCASTCARCAPRSKTTRRNRAGC